MKKNEIRANAKNENGRKQQLNRKLQLNREAIRSLAGTDLKYVAGGLSLNACSNPCSQPCGISIRGACE